VCARGGERVADQAGTDSAIVTRAMTMKSLSRYIRMAVLGSALAVTAGACAGKSINHVLSDPYRYQNREVRISGRVVDSYSIANRGVYLIEDDTGQLWVASERGVPRRGARVKVSGTVREGYNLGVLGSRLRLPNGVVLIEREHEAK
jgi:hypothetical protein